MESIVRFFQEGGSFMYPIAIVAAIGLAIAIERWIYLTASRASNRKAFESLMPLISKRDFKSAMKLGNDSGTPMGELIAAGISRLAGGARRDDVEYAMEEGLMESLPRLEKRTPYLATMANVATLLGLLGTIIGLIAAFTAVANADPAEKATLLSQSISVAMNTTAFGLMTAIPLLILHALLQTKTNEIIDSFEMAGVKVLNTIFDRKPANQAQTTESATKGE
ncbi:MotA/TolQ/ExbB proton channel family protein [Litoribrevibacter euphylliae]|uniref:MotA/TolQ/ExbB proton channel family protein n=1 Tax=Litoribrevibacter euphylliae TaxID=1834034 RepID=A0ABV7HEM4_9GAMM